MPDSLSALQHHILRTLAPLAPPFTLIGGGALAGVYQGHRATRDLDLCWRQRSELGSLVPDTVRLLAAEGLGCRILRTAPAFGEIRVSDETDVCIVDLVAEPFSPIDAPQQVAIGGATLNVDTRHEILVSKLTALLGRAELRDLVDVRALLESGSDLVAALQDAPRKDGGFSALTLAWVLQSLDVQKLSSVLGWTEPPPNVLDAFRLELIARLTELSRPE